MDVEPTAPPLICSPAVVADWVFYAGVHPVRDLYASGACWAMALTQILDPRLMGTLLGRTIKGETKMGSVEVNGTGTDSRGRRHGRWRTALKSVGAVLGVLLVLLVTYGVAIEPRLILDKERIQARLPGLGQEWAGAEVAFFRSAGRDVVGQPWDGRGDRGGDGGGRA